MKEIFLLGDRDPSAVTHRAFDETIARLPAGVRARWVGTDSPEARRTADADGLWVASGSPYRNEEAVYAAIRAARTTTQPFLGTCSGFQYTVLEFARDVAGLADAGHAETAAGGERLVVDRLQCSLIGQERRVTAVPGTRVHTLCGAAPFVGFHWCNYGLSPAYVQMLADHGLVIAATADDAGVEAVELPHHPFFLATLFQPQVARIAGQPLHPIIEAFAAAVRD
jgi:CTP synthase (UTP-ammonia lyase)